MYHKRRVGPTGQQRQEVHDAHDAVAVEVSRTGRAWRRARSPGIEKRLQIRDVDRAVAVDIADRHDGVAAGERASHARLQHVGEVVTEQGHEVVDL